MQEIQFFIQFYNLKYPEDLLSALVQFCEGATEGIEAGIKKEGTLNKLLGAGDKFVEKLLKVGINKDIGMVEATDEFFQLPIPSEFTETISYQYKQSKINVINKLASEIKGYDWSKDTMSRTGVVVDPNVLMTFQGTSPRSFSIAWEIVPRNKKEYDTYKQTIEKLQEYSSTNREFLTVPGTSSKAPISVLRADKLCKFYFLPVAKNDYTNNTKSGGGADSLQINRLIANHLEDTPGFFISDVSVTFSTREQEFRHDGAPAKFRLTLALTERVPLYGHVWKEIFERLKGD